MLDLLKTNTAQLPVTRIRIDGGTQPRMGINGATVDEYAEAMQNGDQFPPVVIYHDGADYWLADGFHRVDAWRIAHPDDPIPVDVRQGDRRDAILHSVGANADHGLRRTNEDKRRAVIRLLEDEEWGQWSDREISRRCRVSNNFVSTLRRSLSSDDSERTYTTKHGTTATMQTANIGSKPPAPASDSLSRRPVRCRDCGRPLTDPAAIAAGIGPCCARKEAGSLDGDGGWESGPLQAAVEAALAALQDDAALACLALPEAPRHLRQAHTNIIYSLRGLRDIL